MGGDSFQNIRKWRNYEFILQHYSLIVYNRPGFEIDKSIPGNITVLNAPLLELSATAIRKLIREKKSLRYLLPENVIAEIEKGGYYRK
jgi:nicotinate-nucleotide adenylyltransferase